MNSRPPAPPARPLVPPEAIEVPGLAAALQQVSAQRMLTCVAELAADGYTGRRVGTPGGQAAAAWLAEQLRELGAGVQLDPFGVSSVRELYHTPVPQWSAGEITRSLEPRREFVEHLASAELPDPRSAPLAGLSAADLGDRWVLAPAGHLPIELDRLEEGATGGPRALLSAHFDGVGDDPAHALLAALDQAGRRAGVPLRAGAMASDNRRYAAHGLAAIGVGMGMPGYQTPAETPDRVEPETLVAAARLLIATVWLLADAHAQRS
ncbi:hypothetical protein FHR32_006335 [Streptosporangium album]|uniref:Peptidase family M28 n=1 Tax=Streptosporangium album TaxID=47479 RepID=A0A7W7S131_9ACTN|nr:hypothetical protein [Streptosporangium album]MBB4941949.1 hypothetical protein [Streptosporangium album]